MPDVFTTSAKSILGDTIKDMRAVIDGASPKILNQRPGGDDTNSIAVLTVHAMHSTRSWLSFVYSAPPPARNRDDEFVATTTDAASLLAFLDDMHRDCAALLDDTATVDWASVRPIRTGEKVAAAWGLIHAIDHLREHMGQITLTRQILDPAWVTSESA